MTKLKFKLTDETIEVFDKTLHRIEALKDFSNVKKGDKGGFIEKEENLSHLGDAWVYDNAKVLDNAIVKDDAAVFNDAKVFDNATISEDAKVFNNAVVCDFAIVCELYK